MHLGDEDLVPRAQEGCIALLTDIVPRAQDGCTALMMASQKCRLVVVQALLAAGADSEAKDKVGGEVTRGGRGGTGAGCMRELRMTLCGASGPHHGAPGASGSRGATETGGA